MENLLEVNLLETVINDVSNKNVKLIYYHINRDGIYPFFQIMLYNYYYSLPFIGYKEQNLTFPCLIYNNIDISISNYISEYLKESLEPMFKDKHVDGLEEIITKGFCVYKDEIYIFIDISSINIDKLYLTKTSEIWFGMLSEIINTKHICNISISKEVNHFIINNIEYFCKIEDVLYPLPEVVYVGNHLKRVEFQSMFGVSKIDNEYGYHYNFSYSLKDALINGKFAKDKLPEFRFGKRLTDDDGKYIEGGINRIAILLDKTKYINKEDVMKLIENNEWEEYIKNYNCIFIISNNINCNDNISIIMQDYKRQIPLSYHKINNKILDEEYLDIM
jgi:hypothetical protein